MASIASLFLILAVTFPVQTIDDTPDLFPHTRPGKQLPDMQVIMDRTKDFCPPFPDKYLKVIVLNRFNPPAGGCVIMQAYNGNIVTAFEMWLGYLDYSYGSDDQEEEVLTEMEDYKYKCSSKRPFIENENIKGWYIQLYNQDAKKNNYRCSLYKILDDKLQTIKIVISADEWCDGLPEMLGRDEHEVPDGRPTNGSLALLFAKSWVPNPFPEYPEYEILNDMCIER